MANDIPSKEDIEKYFFSQQGHIFLIMLIASYVVINWQKRGILCQIKLLILFVEAAEVVEAVGPGVDPKLLGIQYRTVPSFTLNQYGVYGEVAIVPAFALAVYPQKLTPIEATAIWMQYLTAYGALIHYGQITKGDFVLITAASSSVGIAAIEIAKAAGAVSIATTRTPKKKAALIKSGANHVIVTEEEHLPARVKEITSGKGVRIVFDPIAGKGIEILAEATASGGTIFVCGDLALEPTPFPLFLH